MNQDQIEALQKELKRLCGAGGAVKDGVIEIQGDHCDAILRDLERRGIRAKRAGG
jgi:translation initiation factor 1